MGFGSEIHPKADNYNTELIQNVQPEDLVKFGLIPELIGRLPIVVTLDSLDEEALVRVLTEPKNALIKQYQAMLSMDDTVLEFHDDAIRAIAHEALERKTGARGLRAILEALLIDIMFEVPSRDDISKCVITKAVVEQKEQPLLLSQPAIDGNITGEETHNESA